MFDFWDMTEEELKKYLDDESLESDEEEENIRWDSRAVIRPDAQKVDCRDCVHMKYNPCSAYCEVFIAPKGKPAYILWGNSKCAYKISQKEYAKAKKAQKQILSAEKKAKNDSKQ